MNSASQEPNPTEPGTEYELLAPDGTHIRGTLERIEALKGIFRGRRKGSTFSFQLDRRGPKEGVNVQFSVGPTEPMQTTRSELV